MKVNLTKQEIEIISELLSEHINLIDYKIKMEKLLEIKTKQSLFNLKKTEIELFKKLNPIADDRKQKKALAEKF